jgi:hypothetical protein
MFREASELHQTATDELDAFRQAIPDDGLPQFTHAIQGPSLSESMSSFLSFMLSFLSQGRLF